ncbi:MAG TPA: 30S ribosomal protein S19 [Candidatus Nanoarchaeia archaeon]|nr:30S ribosomal protein S19 [Candidatus Nanoarchaeia archaeon]
MARKEFAFKGKTAEELKRMSVEEFSNLLTARQRRKIRRGFREDEKYLLKKIRRGNQNIKTHCRDMIILPEMIGVLIKIHKGTKDWVDVEIQPEMLGHYLGEFAMTRKRVAHNAPGIGATRSSAGVSVK